MAYFWNTRRKVVAWIILFLILFTSAAYTSGFWTQWVTLTASVIFLFIADILFLSENEFVYDPSYASWQQTSRTDGSEYTRGPSEY